MNPQDRELIVAIGRAARTCAMYRELLEVARRYQAADEIERLTAALAQSDSNLADLISKALEDDVRPPAAGSEDSEGTEGS